MVRIGRKAAILLFFGDAIVFIIAFFVALWIRTGIFPTSDTLNPFITPFVILLILWLLIFYAAGLYSRELVLFPLREPDLLIKTQIVNIIIAALFFFAIPTFGIAPKTILVLYFIVSVLFIFFWRLVLYPTFTRKGSTERALLIADESSEVEELTAEVARAKRYGISFSVVAPDMLAREDGENVLSIHKDARLLVVDTSLPSVKQILPLLYRLTRVDQTYQFTDFESMYEEVFDRIPLSQLEHSWFLEKVDNSDTVLYAVGKRLIDIVGGIVMGVVTLVLIPFVFIANELEHPGPLFIQQSRLGRFGKHISVLKFRSMEKNLPTSDKWMTEAENKVTKIGSFLRRTSLDEFPQFLNIIGGSLSLVGPRSDILGLGRRLMEALPYYEARYLVKPGITGWAQINQQYEPGNVSPQSIEENKMRLAYDFYYLKHRSLGLDFVIALRTVKRMFARTSKR